VSRKRPGAAIAGINEFLSVWAGFMAIRSPAQEVGKVKVKDAAGAEVEKSVGFFHDVIEGLKGAADTEGRGSMTCMGTSGSGAGIGTTGVITRP